MSENRLEYLVVELPPCKDKSSYVYATHIESGVCVGFIHVYRGKTEEHWMPSVPMRIREKARVFADFKTGTLPTPPNNGGVF